VSELGETFAALREVSREARARNRHFGGAALRLARIDFISRNMGVHLVVSHAGAVVDYWPGTGLWIVRGSNLKCRGVKRLIEHLRKLEHHERLLA
jgi:hypothetical protein